MRKLAVLLRGISFYNGAGKVCYSDRSVDYEECLESFKVNILQPLSTVFDQIDFFIATYYSDKAIDLLNEFKPRNVIFYPRSQIGKHQKVITPIIIRDVLTLVNTEEYDDILLTRFDLYYYRKLEVDKLDFNKFNFAAKAKAIECIGLCDDSFWLFHSRFTKAIINYANGEISRKTNNCHSFNNHVDRSDIIYISRDILVGSMVDFYFFTRHLPFWDRDNNVINCPRDGTIIFI